jgi:hypothetical protein
MKKVCLVFLALVCLAGFSFGASKASAPAAADTPLFGPGNLSAQLGFGTSIFSGLDLYGGADYGIGSFKIAGKIPFTYGVAARVSYYNYTDIYFGTDYSQSDLGIGALGTVRVSWKDVFPDINWLSKFESYIGIGLGTYIYSDSYDSTLNAFHFGFASLEGNNWYFARNWALNLEEGYYGYGGDLRLGILYKF